jgi:hypothetical protein
MEYTKITYKKQVIFIMLIYSYNEKQMNKYICDNIQKIYFFEQCPKKALFLKTVRELPAGSQPLMRTLPLMRGLPPSPRPLRRRLSVMRGLPPGPRPEFQILQVKNFQSLGKN